MEASEKSQEDPERSPRDPQTALKRLQNCPQQAPEMPLTRNAPTNIQYASDALSNNRHRACWTGTVAGLAAGSWIKRYFAIGSNFQVPKLPGRFSLLSSFPERPRRHGWIRFDILVRRRSWTNSAKRKPRGRGPDPRAAGGATRPWEGFQLLVGQDDLAAALRAGDPHDLDSQLPGPRHGIHLTPQLRIL